MNLAHRDYQEKRNFIRMKVDTPVSITLSDGVPLEGVCHNLSGGGMLISVKETLPLGAELEATVSSGHGHNPMLKALARVNRVLSQPGEVEQPCFVGLTIIEMLD